VPEYSVQPVTVLRALGGISSFSFIAVDVVRIVAGTQQAECSSSIVHQAVGTALDEALVAVAFVVEVALALVCCSLHTRPTAISSSGARSSTLGSPQIVFEIVRVEISLGDNWGTSVPGRIQGRERNRGGDGISVQRVGQLIVIINIFAGVFIDICTPSVFLITFYLGLH